MKVMIVPDSFKGSFSSKEVIDIISDVLTRKVKDIEIIGIPIADGGEGSVDAILEANGGERIYCEVTDPIGRKIKAFYGRSENTCVFEMAQASGIARLKKHEYTVASASTFGTGEMIMDALNKAFPLTFILGIGGSATNDGGTGFAKALGVKFYDRDGRVIEEEGAQILSRITRIDRSSIDPRFASCTLIVMCDVISPLTGIRGATAVYGPQKGLVKAQVESVEKGMENYRQVLFETTGIDVNDIPGSGAAGGLGATLVALFGATLKSGVDTVLDLIDFESKLLGVDFVITGEGRIDGQTILGKVPVGIARRCKGHKVIAIAGCLGEGYEAVYPLGIDQILSTVPKGTTSEKAMLHAKNNLIKTAEKLAEIINGGIDENLD